MKVLFELGLVFTRRYMLKVVTSLHVGDEDS